MTDKTRRTPADLLGVVSVLTVFGLVSVLLFVAARNPSTRPLLSVVVTGLGAGVLILFRQLRKAASSLIASEARAHYVATHDEPTGLANRSLFLRRLAAQGRSGDGRSLAVLCIGVDRFEELGEALGPAAIEAIVAELSARLASVCQETDTLARVGDGLFALLWPGASQARAEAAADQMIRLLAAPCRAAGEAAVISCSIGVAILGPDADQPLEALRQAQLALSSARALGGGRRSVFKPAMDQALKSRQVLEVELRRALKGDELSLAYQPQVDARGALVGVEALLRWNNPRLGAVSPAVFAPMADRCGLSDALGGFALRRALADAKRWPGLKVAVNVSAAQVRSGALIPMLKEAIADFGANPRTLELEITEGVLLADGDDTYDILAAARRMGCALVLDDFGTGYSSLSYLRRFPIDKIKIDQSFVANLGVRPESDAIIKAIVDLARALDLKVLAEGVETRRQADRLLAAGCSHFQGFLFSPPVEPAAIEAMLPKARRAA